MSAAEIPAEVRAQLEPLAEKLGVTVEQMVEQAAAAAPGAAAATTAAAGQAEPPAQEPSVPQSVVDHLTGEMAVLQQELQQTRRNMQTLQEGRVIGSGGLGLAGGAVPTVPDLGSIEPGIRFAYLNDLLSDEDMEKKVGPLLANLLRAHEGGSI